MNTVRYIKSFSKGQITIPKEFRDLFGLINDFWLKLYIDRGRIIAEPIEKTVDKTMYAKSLLAIKGNWINTQEITRNRKDIEKNLAKHTI